MKVKIKDMLSPVDKLKIGLLLNSMGIVITIYNHSVLMLSIFYVLGMVFICIGIYKIIRLNKY